MKLQMVLNSLSFSSIPDEYQARQFMSGLIQTLQAGIKAGLDKVLRTEQPVYSMEFSPNYCVADWFTDRQVEREAKQFFASLVTKCPVLEDLTQAQKDGVMSTECFFEEQSILEIAAVVFFHGVLVSLASAEKWQQPNLVIQSICMLENGDIEEEDAVVTHASSPQHIDSHRAWIQELLRSDLETGADLWTRRGKLFPCLEFCVEVEEQLMDLGKGNPQFKGILEKLTLLDDAARDWTEDAFDPRSALPKASPESESTMQQYESSRIFTKNDGQPIVFSWHVRLTPNAWRLYFDFETTDAPGKLFIGYIGEHLPTTNDPH